MFLVNCFWQLGLSFYRTGMKQKIEVGSRYVSARDPDLIIHSDASASAIAGRGITRNHSAPPAINRIELST